MPELSFNLAALFEKTFGYKTHAFEPILAPVSGNKRLSRVELGVHGSAYYANDALGNEYYMPVTLLYSNEANTGNNPQVLQKYSLPFPVISISSRKTIIETALTERRGTVKELINITDYEIVIKGFIIGATNEFPEIEVSKLRTIYEQNTPIAIQCPLTDIFLLRPDRNGSDQIIISDLQFPAISGVKNVRPYQLTMLSDEPFNLSLIG